MFRLIYLTAWLLVLFSTSFSQKATVTVINLNGTINPAAADYVKYGIKNAANNRSKCLILKLNTPGGLLESTRTIVSNILQSPVPVIVYVAPPGARAASAGVFITMAAHIAVMAPGTNIGAAHPVSLQGQMDSTMTEKATNDAAAFIRTISEKRKRNMKWAESAVRKSLSLTETEALKENVIDYIAPTIDNLLTEINGKEIKTESGNVLLNTKDAKIINLDMKFQHKLLNILSDPNIAYILFMLGIYGLLFELYNPGSIFPGVVGGICLILAFYSMQTLPINYAGLALIIFAIILFVLEIKIVSHGILTIGGVIALILGSIMLIDVDSTLEVVRISWQVIALVVVLTILFFVFAISLAIKAQLKKPTTGAEGILNMQGEAISDLKPDGSVMVHGEIWSAESTEGEIKAGSKIIVTEVVNLKLKVKHLTI